MNFLKELRTIFMACTLFSVLVVDAEETVLVSAESKWKYNDSGQDLGSKWRETGFDDSEWESGKAPLGYGDKHLGTSLSFGKNKNKKFITTYFLHAFEVVDPKAFTHLKLELMRDDGAVVYLNGREILRDNMPEGAIRFDTHASVKVGGSDETSFKLHHISETALVKGHNFLAVEVHQASPNSSDIRLSLKLVGSDQKINNVKLTRGPYLQVGTPTSMTIRWRTRKPAASFVRYGSAYDSLDKTEKYKDAKTEHVVRLTGLKPQTKYFYNIGDGEEVLAGGNAEHFFITSPKVGSEYPVHAWIIGDSGTANQNARAVYESYLKEKGDRYTDLWLMLGDNAYTSGKDIEYQRAVFDLYKKLLPQTPLWPTRGNHERSAEVYYGIFTMPTQADAGGIKSGSEAYYSFDYGNVHFICLDSYQTDRSVNSDMHKWLQADLEATAQTFIVAYWHHPPYTKGSHDSDNVRDSTGRMRDMRQNFLPLLEKGGVDLVLSGHSHCYERSYLLNGHYGTSDTLKPSMILDKGDGKPIKGDGAYTKAKGANEGAVYIVAGNGGKVSGGKLNHAAMFFSLNELGSVIIDAEGTRMDIRLLDYRGQTRDSFRIVKESTK